MADDVHDHEAHEEIEPDQRSVPHAEEPSDEADAEREGTDGGLSKSSDDAELLEETMTPDADSMTTFMPHGLRIN